MHDHLRNTRHNNDFAITGIDVPFSFTKTYACVYVLRRNKTLFLYDILFNDLIKVFDSAYMKNLVLCVDKSKVYYMCVQRSEY